MSYLGREAAKAPIVTADIPDDSITSAKIVDATVAAGDLAANSVDSSELVDGSIDTSHIADDQVTLAKMAHGADGSLITYSASTVPELVAPGTTGHVLTSRGNASTPTFQAASSFNADQAQVFNDSGADVDFRVEGSGRANALFVQGSEGFVGIGTGAPTNFLHCTGSKQYGAYLFANTYGSGGEGVNIASGDTSGNGTLLEFRGSDLALKGAITMSGGNVSYGTFTAHHEVELPEADNNNGYPYGTLVEILEIFYRSYSNTTEAQADLTLANGEPMERGILYKVQKSTSAYSKNVLGAYSNKKIYKPAVLWSEEDFEEGKDGIWTETDFNSSRVAENKIGTPKASTGDERIEAENENLHQVCILGDGHILCNNEKGNISIGDGICTSSTDGIGMKADKMAMIIGLAQEDVSFSGNGSKLVAVQYGLQQFTPWT